MLIDLDIHIDLCYYLTLISRVRFVVIKGSIFVSGKTSTV